ncbi:MAG: cache domain-containing protein [Pontiellaceae bacterium]|nr:cache domain-containing protein [Pontiellaceae bacterium]MBN2785817.1 cache domain-containing protein [Pontiellaceae bacterium]
MKYKAWIVGIIALLTGSSLTVAQEDVAALAAESEAYCASTARNEPTAPSTVVEKVDKACSLLEKEGQAAFPKFQGEGSEFIFDGTYMWIHTLTDAKMLMHPIKYKMVGNLYTGLKDKSGKRFFVVMNQICTDEKSGWVEYLWPKPGGNDVIRKISYVKTCTMPDGTAVVVGCGLYNYDEAALTNLKIQ